MIAIVIGTVTVGISGFNSLKSMQIRAQRPSQIYYCDAIVNAQGGAVRKQLEVLRKLEQYPIQPTDSLSVLVGQGTMTEQIRGDTILYKGIGVKKDGIQPKAIVQLEKGVDGQFAQKTVSSALVDQKVTLTIHTYPGIENQQETGVSFSVSRNRSKKAQQCNGTLFINDRGQIGIRYDEVNPLTTIYK
jgi:hypothetical protein